MPADKKHCKALIGKLGGLPGFPREYPTAVVAMIETLADRARDDDHATHVIVSLLESAERCPVVSDIIRVCHETAKGFARMREPGCMYCLEGWRRVWFLTTKGHGRWKHERISQERAAELEPRIDPRSQCVTEAVERCECAIPLTGKRV
jgi:hypothetical protein